MQGSSSYYGATRGLCDLSASPGLNPELCHVAHMMVYSVYIIASSDVCVVPDESTQVYTHMFDRVRAATASRHVLADVCMMSVYGRQGVLPSSLSSTRRASCLHRCWVGTTPDTMMRSLSVCTQALCKHAFDGSGQCRDLSSVACIQSWSNMRSMKPEKAANVTQPAHIALGPPLLARTPPAAQPAYTALYISCLARICSCHYLVSILRSLAEAMQEVLHKY